MDWSNNIPTQTRRETKQPSSDLLNPFWIFKTALLGFAGVLVYFVAELMLTPMMMATFGPLYVFFGVALACILVAGVAIRVAWWIITLPFRIFGGR